MKTQSSKFKIGFLGVLCIVIAGSIWYSKEGDATRGRQKAQIKQQQAMGAAAPAEIARLAAAIQAIDGDAAGTAGITGHNDPIGQAIIRINAIPVGGGGITVADVNNGMIALATDLGMNPAAPRVPGFKPMPANPANTPNDAAAAINVIDDASFGVAVGLIRAHVGNLTPLNLFATGPHGEPNNPALADERKGDTVQEYIDNLRKGMAKVLTFLVTGANLQNPAVNLNAVLNGTLAAENLTAGWFNAPNGAYTPPRHANTPLVQ